MWEEEETYYLLYIKNIHAIVKWKKESVNKQIQEVSGRNYMRNSEKNCMKTSFHMVSMKNERKN